jgi:hypothetical protein
MGNWKLKRLKKELAGRKNSTRSQKARVYFMCPPQGGWVGGPQETGGRKVAM